ncbi:cyclin-dependent protein kinase inhibitor SMR1-like [Wolffia australiana]
MAATPELTTGLKLRVPAAPPVAETDDGVCGGEACGTPTSKESRIPAMTLCPPAPKKTRRLSGPRKRRSRDVELICLSSDQMERLFRPLDAPRLAAPLVTRKRKRCYPG